MQQIHWIFQSNRYSIQFSSYALNVLLGFKESINKGKRKEIELDDVSNGEMTCRDKHTVSLGDF